MNSFATKRKDSRFVRQADANVNKMSDQGLRDMLGEAAVAGLKAVMRNYYFTIAGDIYCQVDGSSIRLDLTTEVAILYMLLWDEEFYKSARG